MVAFVAVWRWMSFFLLQLEDVKRKSEILKTMIDQRQQTAGSYYTYSSSSADSADTAVSIDWLFLRLTSCCLIETHVVKRRYVWLNLMMFWLSQSQSTYDSRSDQLSRTRADVETTKSRPNHRETSAGSRSQPRHRSRRSAGALAYISITIFFKLTRTHWVLIGNVYSFELAKSRIIAFAYNLTAIATIAWSSQISFWFAQEDFSVSGALTLTHSASRSVLLTLGL